MISSSRRDSLSGGKVSRCCHTCFTRWNSASLSQISFPRSASSAENCFHQAPAASGWYAPRPWQKTPGDARQQLPALLERDQRVGKVRRLRIIHYRGDLLPLTANAFIKCRSVMGIINQIKLGCLIRQQTDAQKGLLSAIIISRTR